MRIDMSECEGCKELKKSLAEFIDVFLDSKTDDHIGMLGDHDHKLVGHWDRDRLKRIRDRIK